MSYRLIIGENITIDTSMTLGNVFTALDNWCYENNGKYDFESIYHKSTNEIGIDVLINNESIQKFTIIQN